MRALLIQANNPFMKTHLAFPPLNLAYIAAVLEASSHEVRVLDAFIKDLSPEEVEHEIRNFMPEVLGLTVSSMTLREDMAVARLAKTVRKDIVVVAGGPHPTVMPGELLLKEPCIDYVVKGEGEMVMQALLRDLEEGRPISERPGLAYRQGEGQVVEGPLEAVKDLDALPHPARHLLDPDDYKKPPSWFGMGKGDRIQTILASRGCPYECIFCSLTPISQRKWRTRDVSDVAAEVEEVLHKYSTYNFIFIDPEFTLNSERVEALCEEMIKRKLKIYWSCSARPNLLTEKMLKLMKEAGCWKVFLGVESASQPILDRIKKGFRIEQAQKAIDLARKVGIKTTAAFILGLPGESHQSIEESLKFALKAKPDYVQASIATPFPGTALFEMLKREGRIDEDVWDRGLNAKEKSFSGFMDRCLFTPENMSPEELERALKKFMKAIYLRPSYLLKRALSVRSFYQIAEGFKILKRALEL